MKVISKPDFNSKSDSSKLMEAMLNLKKGEALVLETALELLKAQKIKQKSEFNDSLTGIKINGEMVIFTREKYLHRCSFCKKEVAGIKHPPGWIGNGSNPFNDTTDNWAMVCEKCRKQ